MNPYFWFFALYALMITPLGIQFHIRLDHGIHYRIRMRVSGFPVFRAKQTEEAPEKPIDSQDLLKNLNSRTFGFWIKFIREGELRRLLRLFAWQDAELRIRLSFQDAAGTSLLFAAIRAFLQTAASIRPLPIKGGVEMDFRGEGAQLSFRCIASARLGNITAAALRLWLAFARYQAAQTAKEENHAASH